MIYLDSAATTLQKPPEVARAVARGIGTMASVGRGGHGPGMRAAETAFACRRLAAELFHAADPDHVVLTHNATHGLNIAIRSLIKPGDTVLISGYEHNAVTRPLYAMPGVKIHVAAAPLFDREGMVRAFADVLARQKVDAVICNHVSNVFGYVLPVEEIAKMCARRGIPFVLDASQSAGTLPVHMDELKAAFIAMPGHKGLYGPQGTGLLICGEGETTPVLFGGTGSVSQRQEMPDFLPDRLEAGTQNVCGAAGLIEGLRFVMRKSPRRIGRYEQSLNRCMMEGLSRLPGVTVYRGGDEAQSGLCSFRVEGRDCEEVGELLGKRGIAVRAGLHCAPLAHRSAGTEESGTVRVSFSAFNRMSEVERALSAVKQIL